MLTLFFRNTIAVYIALLFIISMPQLAWGKMYNVYIPIQHTKLYSAIMRWNTALLSDEAVKPFNVAPFQPRFPLHSSLYLSKFKSKNISSIKALIKTIAKSYPSFMLCTSDLYLTSGQWLMLGFEFHGENASAVHSLQNLSDKIVTDLSAWRDTSAVIPAWAKHDLTKVKAFEQYGSPNVFSSFEPHISLAGPPKILPETEAVFQAVLSKYIASHPLPHYCVNVTSIAVGEVNALGQITHEISRYALKKTS